MKWRKEELHSLYYPPDTAGFCKVTGISCSWRKTELHTILAGKPEGKGLLLRPRGRWGDSIKMDFKDAGWGKCRVDLYDSAYGPGAVSFECGTYDPSGMIKCTAFVFGSVWNY
jgi:hypothetical protein